MTTGSEGELPHRFDRCSASLGQRRATQATRGDREWVKGAKGGQPERVSGCEGGDAFGFVRAACGGALVEVEPEPAIGGSVRRRGTGVGAAGAVEELAAVSVVGAPGRDGGAFVGQNVGYSTHFSCVWNSLIKARVRFQNRWCCPEFSVMVLARVRRRKGRSVWLSMMVVCGLFALAARM
jgi:hypothetical protein